MNEVVKVSWISARVNFTSSVREIYYTNLYESDVFSITNTKSMFELAFYPRIYI